MIGGLLLAAGDSRRFGGDKLLASLPDDRTVVAASATALATGCDVVRAVVRPGDDAVTDRLAALGIETLACPDAALGMGHSLAWGARASGDLDGVVVMLADMPWVRGSTVRAVADALREGAAIARPYQGNQPGHPVGFAGVFLPALATLRGDTGARAIIARHADAVRRLTVDDPGILRDIDTPDDLA